MRRNDAFWTLKHGDATLASGPCTDDQIRLPHPLAEGSYDLDLMDSGSPVERLLLLVAPTKAYQPDFFSSERRAWILMAPLYAIRSRRNWGHGDFTDLLQLIDIAVKSGSTGVGLNPLHALAAGQASPYSPSSRLFLNLCYIDIEAIPECPGLDVCGLRQQVDNLRVTTEIDYASVYSTKHRALTATFEAFRADAHTERRDAFDSFRHKGGERLAKFAAFEALQNRFGLPWQQWPSQFRSPNPNALETIEPSAPALPAFIQWIAHEQLLACACRARDCALPLGLYLDVAVGVDRAGADAWTSQSLYMPNLTVGAPPDIFNPAGQNWGLLAMHPQALIDSDFSDFRQMLRAAMHYSGAIRLDHILGLYRLYLIPSGTPTAHGVYVRFPFEALLAVIAQESMRCRCLVIGEDLGTVPAGLSETLHDWGLWSYRVAMFERNDDGLFRQPDRYPEQAVLTFNTHDLPTFAGWRETHDLQVKAGLGIDPGESLHDRDDAHRAMRETLRREDLPQDLRLIPVFRYLARARSRLLAVALEDILELRDQINVPGTIDEYPNWRQRLPIDLEDLPAHPMLGAVASIMAEAGRSAKFS